MGNIALRKEVQDLRAFEKLQKQYALIRNKIVILDALIDKTISFHTINRAELNILRFRLRYFASTVRKATNKKQCLKVMPAAKEIIKLLDGFIKECEMALDQQQPDWIKVTLVNHSKEPMEHLQSDFLSDATFYCPR